MRSAISFLRFLRLRAAGAPQAGAQRRPVPLLYPAPALSPPQDENKHSLEEARKAFPNAKFQVG